MTSHPPAAVILAAGKGTRMKSALPKVLHPVAGKAMIRHVLDSLAPLGCGRVVVVVAPGMDQVAAAVKPHATAVQEEQLGTADAVKAALPALSPAAGDVLVLYGDTPFISTRTLERMLERRRAADAPAVVVLGMRPADPGEYGRLVLGADGGLQAIVEHKDATAEERRIDLCNSGVMAIDGAELAALLAQVRNDNAKGEYYLTDIVAIARARGRACAVVEAPVDELMGVNSRAELAAAEAILQDRLRRRAMEEGATLIDPASVWLCHDTRLGRDVTVGPNVVFGPGVAVGDGVEIRAFCHIEGATVASGAVIGPFARLRPGAEIGPKARIGNFVEVKNATLGPGAKANHLAYVGDAAVGAGANVGAGTITCNYDGYDKTRTEIGEGVFIGSNSTLVAPLTIGRGAYVAAGSVVTQDVAADALAVGRGRQVEKPGWAALFHERKRALRAAKGPRPEKPKKED
ncbi:MAG: bifunctional protein GlmU [Alphaproteobacteria bacterium]|nr:MAG: bifunctional protein GlmU [Alphaproteobacteria bacterium]